MQSLKTVMSCPNYNVIFKLIHVAFLRVDNIFSVFVFLVVATVCMTNGPSGLYHTVR